MKTVSFDDEAYNLLKGAKRSPSESFSDVVKREFGSRRDLLDSAGAWADASDDDIEQLRDETRRAFGSTTG